MKDRGLQWLPKSFMLVPLRVEVVSTRMIRGVDSGPHGLMALARAYACVLCRTKYITPFGTPFAGSNETQIACRIPGTTSLKGSIKTQNSEKMRNRWQNEEDRRADEARYCDKHSFASASSVAWCLDRNFDHNRRQTWEFIITRSYSKVEERAKPARSERTRATAASPTAG